MADIAKILRLYDELKENKADFESHLQDIASVMLPRRGGFAGTADPQGNRLNDEIIDATPQQAARGLASAMGTMMRPEGQKWFFIRAEDTRLNEDDEARGWFEESENRMRSRAFENPKSRFRQTAGDADLDLVTFGTAAMFIGERRDIRGMLYQSLGLKNIYIVTDENGNVDGLIRRHMLNPRQAIQFFGAGKVAKSIKDLEAQGKHNGKIEHIHVVMPRTERGLGGFATDLPYMSIWIEVMGKEQLTESGFHEFPFVIPRFDTTTGEDWGRGPGMIALPDANMLQAVGETLIIGGQKMVEPPIFAPDDGTFNASNTFPGGITYYDAELAKELGRIPIEAMNVKADIKMGMELRLDIREQVKNAFYKNVLNLPVDGPEMTATEVVKRDQEFLREMGGLFGRLESDYIAPIVERTFNVMLRAGAFPEIPEVLQGQNVRFEYESPLKKVRQQIEAAAARNWKEDLLTLAITGGRPEVLDVLDVDAYARFQADANSVPFRLQRSQEAIAALRQQRAEAQQAQMELAAMESMAQSEEKGTKAMKNLMVKPTAGAGNAA